MELLNRMGLSEDPYSIFQEASASQEEAGTDVSSARKLRASDNDDNECQNPKSAASASSSTRHSHLRSQGMLNNNPLNAVPAGEMMTDAEPAHINDEEGSTHDDEKKAPAFGSYVNAFAESFDGIRSGFKDATGDNNPDSLTFYGYLMRYFEAKAKNQDFDLGDDNKTIMDAVHSFESTKEKIAMAKQEKNCAVAVDVDVDATGLTVYQHLLSHIIAKCKKKLPLPLA